MTIPELDDGFRINEPAPDIPGGNQRPSKRISLERFDAIRRRQELNSMFLQRACGQADLSPLVFKPEDLNILLQIARERDPNGNPAIRKHAIQALGQFRDLETMEILWEIAASPMEHEAIRGQALKSLNRMAPRIAPLLLQTQLGNASALIRLATVNALAENEDAFTLQLLTRLLRREKDMGVRERAFLVAQSIGKQLRVRVPKPKLPKRPKTPRTPKSEK